MLPEPLEPCTLFANAQDTFDPKDFGPQSSQRMATVLVYLSGEDVRMSGEKVGRIARGAGGKCKGKVGQGGGWPRWWCS